MIKYKTNRKRPIEKLTGDNRGIVRLRLGNIHCETPLRECLRICRPADFRKVPPALRRGWVKCVIDTINEYRGVYRNVR